MKPALLTVPAKLVAETLPLAPTPTMAVILVAEFMVNDDAATPPKLTAVTVLRPVPVMVTALPVAADVGENDVMVTGGT